MPFTASVCSQPAPPISGLEAPRILSAVAVHIAQADARVDTGRAVPSPQLRRGCRLACTGSLSSQTAPSGQWPARRTRLNGTPARACRIARRVLLLCRVPRRPFALELSPASSEHVGQRGRPRPWATVVNAEPGDPPRLDRLLQPSTSVAVTVESRPGQPTGTQRRTPAFQLARSASSSS